MEKRIGIITTAFYALLTLYAVAGTVYVLQDFPHSPQEIVSVALTMFAVLTITVFSGLFLLDRYRVTKT
jgi:drug/metabolite transporter (DMT)-like permease